MATQPVALLRRVASVLLALVAVTACQQPTPPGRRAASKAAATDSEDAVPEPNGRYRIVDPTPQFAHNIMLIDTQTGRTWLMCTTNDSTTSVPTNWCPLVFVGAAPAPSAVPGAR